MRKAFKMRAPSELDPLLPQNDTAPEITGPGFSKKRFDEAQFYNDSPSVYTVKDEGEDDTQSTSEPSSKSALGSIVSIFTVVVFVALVITLLSPHPSDQDRWPLPKPRPALTIEERVSSILDGTPLIDGHNDLAIFLRGRYKNKIHTAEFKDKFENGGMQANVDLPRLKAGQVGGAFWSAFVVCPVNASEDFSDENYATSVSHTLSQIDLIHRLQAQYPSNFTAAGTPLGTALTKFHSSKSLLSPISIEGLHQVPQSAPMSTLRLYYSLGVRAATLTWNCHNAFADAALVYSDGTFTPAPYHRGGLTPAGRNVIREMNRLGMLIDISHTSYWTQKAVLSNKTSAAPVIYSHSSAFTLCQHPRNVHDDILELVKQTKSLVMINFSPDFISCLAPPNSSVLPEFYPKNNTLHQVARHVVYVGEKIGYDYVGFGSDYDGMGEVTPKGLEGVDKFPNLVAELLKMGVSDRDAAKVVGGNLLRVWQTAEAIAKGMQEKGVLEGEDEISGW